MADTERLEIRLDFWDDFVGAFEPMKVIRQLKAAFPEVELDPTDHQQVRLLQELALWTQTEMPAERRGTLMRQSWGNYQTNGPTYKFVIPFASGHRVTGFARRLTVGFQMPADLPAAARERLIVFLRSLRMGEPELHEKDSAKPTVDEDRTSRS